jgi:hypothetical protein
MSPTLHYKLNNCIYGWSKLKLNPINVRNILNISYNKRLFTIVQPEYKYSLTINYYNPRTEFDVTPVFGLPSYGIALSYKYEHASYITFRFKTEDDVKQEIKKIEELQNIIKEFDKNEDKKNIKFANLHQNKQ